MAYTYHLYHIPTDKHYYGVRYGKGCSPDELWKSYFSSSTLVHKLIEEYGQDSFVFSVRKVFETSEQAVAWESRFLLKVNAQHNDKWLNRHNGSNSFIGPHTHSEQSKAKIRSKIKGIKRSDETKAKMRVKAKEREERRRVEGWKYPADAQIRARETLRARIAETGYDPWNTPEYRKKLSERKKGTKRQYLEDGSFIMVRP